MLTSLKVEQKRMTQLIRIGKMAALEQRSAIKFCVVNTISRQETLIMLKTALYKWYSKFEQGDDSVSDKPRPGCPLSISTKKIETVKELFDSDRWKEISQLGLGIPGSAVAQW